jgi:hypothetical protein
MSAFFKKAADVAHKTVLLGLFSLTGWQAYQIAKNVLEGRFESPYLQSNYKKEIDAKVREEYAKDNVIDSSRDRDWYTEGDDSHLEGQLRPAITRPEFKRQYEEQQRAKQQQQ